LKGTEGQAVPAPPDTAALNGTGIYATLREGVAREKEKRTRSLPVSVPCIDGAGTACAKGILPEIIDRAAVWMGRRKRGMGWG